MGIVEAVMWLSLISADLVTGQYEMRHNLNDKFIWWVTDGFN